MSESDRKCHACMVPVTDKNFGLYDVNEDIHYCSKCLKEKKYQRKCEQRLKEWQKDSDWWKGDDRHRS